MIHTPIKQKELKKKLTDDWVKENGFVFKTVSIIRQICYITQSIQKYNSVLNRFVDLS